MELLKMIRFQINCRKATHLRAYLHARMEQEPTADLWLKLADEDEEIMKLIDPMIDEPRNGGQ